MGLNVGGLWNKVQLYPKEFQSLFTVVPVALSRTTFKLLYTIEWSPEGSNRKSKEEETIYCWELYLKKIEGICVENKTVPENVISQSETRKIA